MPLTLTAGAPVSKLSVVKLSDTEALPLPASLFLCLARISDCII